MTHLVVLNLGNGDWQRGLPTVIAQLWDDHSPNPMQFTGSLPPAPELNARYHQWRSLYDAFYSTLGWRRSGTRSSLFEIDQTDVTHISELEFKDISKRLQAELNQWLRSDSFHNIDTQLRTRLKPTDQIRLIMIAENLDLRRSPWSLWSFLDDYPNAEIALSLPEYTRSVKTIAPRTTGKVNILAILGNSSGIDIATDQQILQKLPNAHLKFLIEPTVEQLTQQLWELSWDILFFAGHSSSVGEGHIQLNQTEQLTISQLKYGLKTAIAHGLKLAIFNSCDGLGLAQDLADLNLPQLIVMREPIPDRIAQTFLKQFLTTFSGGKSLYASVREAREKLQALENQFPCATWLPVLCQNPAEVPPLWRDWYGTPPLKLSLPTRRDWQTIVLSSLAVTSLVVGVRWLGGLQSMELWAFDRLLQMRPAEIPDDRLLVVTITDQDIQAEGAAMRQGSISDATLNRLLDRLEQHQPNGIGLDLYRDTPATNSALAARLKTSDRLIAICKRPEGNVDATGIMPPPEVPESRVSLNTVLVDLDGVIRRHLLFLSPHSTSRCTPAYTLSVQLAARYLESKGIAAQFTPQQDLRFGNTVFYRLRDRAGGYQTIDARGGQVLLNYRAAPTPQAVANQITAHQVLSGQVNPTAIKGKIVLVGIAAPLSGGDYWTTPYGKSRSAELPGVLIHAQMVSQILSAVLDHRPLLWVWSTGIEVLWIGGWALLGGIVGWGLHRVPLGLLTAQAIATSSLVGISWVLLLHGGWIPLLPPVASLFMAGVVVTLIPAPSSSQDTVL